MHDTATIDQIYNAIFFFTYPAPLPADHNITGEQLRHTSAPVPKDSVLGTVTLEEMQGGPHQVPQLHPPGSILDGWWLLACEVEPLENWGCSAEISCGKPIKSLCKRTQSHIDTDVIYHTWVLTEVLIYTATILTLVRQDWSSGACWEPHISVHVNHDSAGHLLWLSRHSSPTDPESKAASDGQSAACTLSLTGDELNTPKCIACLAGSISKQKQIDQSDLGEKITRTYVQTLW